MDNIFAEGKRKRLKEFVITIVGEAANFLYGESGWENVNNHCFIEAARVAVLADLLGVKGEWKLDAVTAALLHDGHKKEEIAAIQEEIGRGGSGYSASNIVTKKYLDKLIVEGVPRQIVRFIGFVGGMPSALIEIEKIINKKIFTEKDIAVLIVHYVDDYTKGDEWVEAVDLTYGDGIINDVDRRVERNKNNPNYKRIDEEATRFLRGTAFSGMNSFEAMARVSHEIERIFSAQMQKTMAANIDPLRIPEMIDTILRKRITS